MNIKTIDKYYSYLLYAMIAAVAGAIIYLGYLTWPWADDFTLMNEIRASDGIVDYVRHMYINWESRFFGDIFFFIMLRGVEYTHFSVTVLVACFISIAFLMVNLWQKLFFPENRGINYLACFLMLCSLWVGLRPIESQVLYWTTGGIQYTMVAFFAFIWMTAVYYLAMEPNHVKYKKFTIPAFVLVSFFLGGGNQVLTPVLILWGVFITFLSGRFGGDNKVPIIVSLIMLLVGGLVMYVSPGALLRAGEGTGSFVFSPGVIIENYGKVFLKFTLCCKNVIFLTAISAIVSSIYTEYFCRETANSGKEKTVTKRDLLVIGSFLFCALFSLAPFTLVPAFMPKRASLFYQLFIVMFMWSGISCLAKVVLGRVKQDKVMLLVYIVPIVFFVVTFGMARGDIVFGKEISRIMRDRHTYLTSLSPEEKNRKILVEPVPKKMPETLVSDDISYRDERYYWQNRAVAKYYGVKSIFPKGKYQTKEIGDRAKKFGSYEYFF